MPYRYTIEDSYALPADAVFAAAIDFDMLQAETRGIARYEGLPSGKAVLGADYTTRLTLFGFLPLGSYRIRVTELDEAARTIRSEEGGGMVRYHNHRITVLDRGDSTSIFRDEIEGRIAFGLTPIAGPVVRAMYAARHKKRKAALGLPS
jgi:hypothetical protein